MKILEKKELHKVVKWECRCGICGSLARIIIGKGDPMVRGEEWNNWTSELPATYVCDWICPICDTYQGTVDGEYGKRMEEQVLTEEDREEIEEYKKFERDPRLDARAYLMRK